MFERFTRAARAVVVDAHDRAHDEEASEVREEHLLAALLAAPRTRPLLERLGVATGTDAPVLDAIREARRRGGLSDLDAEALAGLGIDLDTVVHKVEADLGAGALGDACVGDRRPRRLLLSSDSKRVLRAALHQAVARGDRELHEEHLLLGQLAHPGPVRDALGSRGVTTATVLAVLDSHGPDQGQVP